MRFIDISNWEGGIDLPALLPNVDGIVCKATQGKTFVDPYCDGWVQQCLVARKPWGFYHFAGDNDAAEEADYFITQTMNYFGHGIPILDWEGVYDEYGNLIFDQPVSWANTFVRRVHEKTGVWPWIYGNPWRFNQGGVEPNCARYVAEYPAVTSPSFEQAESWECSETDGNVVAWQFCSDGRVSGYNGNLDCSLFYGTENQWRAYALGANSETDSGGTNAGTDSSVSTLENDEYKITVERK